jgi:hypothetical protein
MRPSTVGATTPRPAGKLAKLGHTGTDVSAIVS